MQKIGYSQPEGLAAELLRRGDIDRLGHRVGIDGLRVRGGRAHFLAALLLRRTGLIAVEARHTRDDDFVAIRLVHAIAHPAAEGEEWETGNRRPETGKLECGVGSARHSEIGEPRPETGEGKQEAG
jgi:hypothetical protein